MSGSRKDWTSSAYDENPYRDEVDTAPLALGGGGNPPWLQPGAPTKPVPYIPPTFSSSSSSSTPPVDTAVSEEPRSMVPRFILYTRIINLILSVLMILVSLLSLLTTQTATTGVLSCYVVVFSCLLCCFETHLKQVSKMIALNFGFMYSAKSRSVFMMFVGTILFSFSLFGKIIGICMLANAGFNIYILCKYPEYEDVQRNDAQSDIKDFLAKNPAFAKNITDFGIKAGGEILQNNPDLVRQGAHAAMASSSTAPTSDGRGDYANV